MPLPLFRTAATKVRDDLAIKAEISSVIRVKESDLSTDRSKISAESEPDIQWSRRHNIDMGSNEDDYVDASGDVGLLDVVHMSGSVTVRQGQAPQFGKCLHNMWDFVTKVLSVDGVTGMTP